MHADATDVLSEVLDQLESTVRRFVLDRDLGQAQAECDGGTPAFPEGFYQRAIAVGFDRLALPEAFGGFSFPPAATARLLQVLARSCAGHASIFAFQLSLSGAIVRLTEPAAHRGLERALEGHAPLALAHGDTLGETLDHLELHATAGANGTVHLAGDAGTVVNAHGAGEVLLFAATADSDRCLALLVPWSRLQRGDRELEQKLGLRALPLSIVGDLELVLPGELVIARGNAALELHCDLQGRLGWTVAAIALGLMEDAHDCALNYARERYQGGKLIIDHSHLRDILAEMARMIETGRLVVRAAPECDAAQAVAAKTTLCRDAIDVCTNAVQLLGGYGYMKDFGLEKKLRDAATLSLLPPSWRQRQF
jgi:alkylation response protein AidB-like acyl-CoA dehydrogenase